jgi:citronellol/citronellal dehydrogenase
MTGALAADANAGRTVLITGGGTGIGRATAIAFARTGARAVICGRRPEPLSETAAELDKLGAECLAVPCDIREPDQVRGLLDDALERFGAIDVLVNNAGGQFTAPAEEITTKGMRAVHRLTIDAAWELSREVATRSMVPGAGGLIVFGSFSPRRGIPGFAHASAARAALENLAQGLALEWSRHSIRVVCAALGNIETEGLASYGPEALEAARRQVPLGRLGTPEEVAETIAWLATDAAGYITGTTITIDGGLDAWGQGEPPPEPS